MYEHADPSERRVWQQLELLDHRLAVLEKRPATSKREGKRARPKLAAAAAGDKSAP